MGKIAQENHNLKLKLNENLNKMVTLKNEQGNEIKQIIHNAGHTVQLNQIRHWKDLRKHLTE